MGAGAVLRGQARNVYTRGGSSADRSGAGGFGSRSIIALTAPPYGAPTLPAIHLAATDASFVTRNAAVAGIGTAMIDAIAARPTD